MRVQENITGTILIIDKNERLPREKSVFENAGFTVITAINAEEGIMKAREFHPDVVVSEVMLEKADSGFVLGYKMKQDEELKDIPLVLLSSIFAQTGKIFDLSSPESRRWIKADLYLERPVAPDRLIAKVKSFITQSHK
jgi:CheY-like chemotaxis protein